MTAFILGWKRQGKQNGMICIYDTGQFSSVQSLSRVRLFATPWIAARQASLSITNSRSSLGLTSIESVMPSSHLILCCPLLLLPPIPLSAVEKKLSLYSLGFPGASADKESAYSAGDQGSVPGSGRSPGEENGYPLQYSCLENSMDRGAWWATVHAIPKSWAGLRD